MESTVYIDVDEEKNSATDTNASKPLNIVKRESKNTTDEIDSNDDSSVVEILSLGMTPGAGTGADDADSKPDDDVIVKKEEFGVFGSNVSLFCKQEKEAVDQKILVKKVSKFIFLLLILFSIDFSLIISREAMSYMI